MYFYFGMMLLGKILKDNREHIVACKTKWPLLIRINFLLCLASVLLWATTYACIFVFNKGYEVQFLINVGVFGFVATAVTLSWDQYWREVKAVFMVADSTLEIYLVQILAVSVITALNLSFPFNLLLFFVIAFTGGIVFHFLLGKVYLFFRNKP